MFLIHNKKTNKFLSSLDEKGRTRRRGHTHAKLSNIDPPRLFRNKQGANYAPRAWLKGRITVTRDYGLDYNGEDISENWKTEKDETRIAEDMEIRECEIVLK